MALKEAGIRLTLQGQQSYLAGLKSISSETKALATQSKLAVAQLGNNAKITDTYKTKMSGLTAQMDVSKNKTSLLRAEQDKLQKIYKELPSKVTSVNRAYQDSAKETERLKNNYQQMKKALGENHSETQKVKEQWEASKQTTAALKKEYTELSKELKVTEKELASLPDSINKAELATQQLRNEAQKLHEEYRNNGGWAADYAKNLQDFGDKAQVIGGNLQNFGASWTRNITMPMVGLGAAALKSAMDWESAFTGVKKTNDEVVDANGKVIYSYADLEKGLRNLAKTTPLSHTEIAGLAETLGQLGIPTDEVVEFTDIVAKMGVTTNLSSEEAATAMAQFLNITQSGNHTVSNLGSSIVELGNNMATTEKDILMMSQRWATTGKQIGLADHQMMAISATLLSMGVNVEAGGSALQRFGQKVNSAVIDGSDKLDILAKTAGVTSEEFAKSWREKPAEAMQLFLKGLNESKDAGENVNETLKDLGITSVNELNALLALAGGHELLGKALDMSAKAYKENTALSEEAAKAYETTASKLQVFWNKLKDVAITFGGPLLDALTSALEAAEPWIAKAAEMAEAFANMDQEGQRNILMWAGIIAAVGPVASILGNVISVVGKTSSGLATLVKWIGKITTPKDLVSMPGHLGKVASSATSAGGAAALFSNPWVLAGAAAIAAVGGFILYMNNEAQKPFKAHNESVRETNGAYQEWFDAVTVGAKSIDELNSKAQQNADETTANYKEQVEEVMKMNQQVQEMQGKMWSNKNWWENLLYNSYQEIEIAGKKVNVVFDDMRKKMHELGQEDAFDKVIPKIEDYTTTLGNALLNTINHMQEQKNVTDEWANGQITQISRVTKDVVENYEQQKQAEIEALETKRQNLNKSQEWYDQELAAINAKYSKQQGIVTQAEANISGILQQAASENRKLTEQETLSMLKSYQQLAEGAGQSLSTLPEAMNLIGDNLSLFVSSFGLDFLVAAGVIDEATAKMIASMGSTEDKTNLLKQALEGISDLHVAPTAEVKVYGEEELQRIVELFGGDWASLTNEQKTALVNAEGSEELEDLLFDYGVWKAESPTEAKKAVLEGQITPEFNSVMESHGLWTDAEFVSKFANIETNAPEAETEIRNLLTEWGIVLPQDTKILNTQTNAGENAPKVQEYQQAVNNTQDKTVGLTSNLFGMVANLVTIGLYKSASDNLQDKSVTASTSAPTAAEDANKISEYNTNASNMKSTSVTATTNVPNGPLHSQQISDYNKRSGEMKNTSATASTSTPSMTTHTSNIADYNDKAGAMRNTSSTATTSAPNISSNTSAVNSWNTAMNASYSKTSVMTTVYEKVYRTIGKHATGGHIGAFANGGNITQWGGAFANGGNVPVGYTGLVGEAGPEIFQVTKKGVNITPLSTREKMRGIEGVLSDFQGGTPSSEIKVSVNISDIVIRDDRDIDLLAKTIGDKIAKGMERDRMMRKGRIANNVRA